MMTYGGGKNEVGNINLTEEKIEPFRTTQGSKSEVFYVCNLTIFVIFLNYNSSTGKITT